jgi:hypothetical protein
LVSVNLCVGGLALVELVVVGKLTFPNLLLRVDESKRILGSAGKLIEEELARVLTPRVDDLDRLSEQSSNLANVKVGNGGRVEKLIENFGGNTAALGDVLDRMSCQGEAGSGSHEEKFL